MSGEIFISYASPDRAAADRLCEDLERAGHRCWIAPRDIVPGQNYVEAIKTAISDAALIVVLVSAAANDSAQVARELEFATDTRHVLLAARLENVTVGPALMELLGAFSNTDLFASWSDGSAKLIGDVTRLRAAQIRGASPAAPPPPPTYASDVLLRPLSEDELDRKSRRRLARPGAIPSFEPPEGVAYANASPGSARASYPAASMGGGGGAGGGRGLGKLLLFAGAAAVGIGLVLVAGKHLVGGLLALLHHSAIPPVANPAEDSDTVDVSVFAPPGARPGDSILVQVFLHPFDYAPAELQASAIAADPTAAMRAASPLDVDLVRGETIEIGLDAAGVEIEEPLQSLVWRGRARALSFLVALPPDHDGRSIQFRVRVLRASVPIAQLRFAMQVAAHAAPQPLAPVAAEPSRFTRAFLSYSSEDRSEVLKRAQALKAARITVFQDLLSLEPGQAWEDRLWDEIENCDLFLLFWSESARNSPWVMREIERALEIRRARGGSTPEIMPVILEGPPPPAPPEHLQHLHFNDPICYLITAASPAP